MPRSWRKGHAASGGRNAPLGQDIDESTTVSRRSRVDSSDEEDTSSQGGRLTSRSARLEPQARRIEMTAPVSRVTATVPMPQAAKHSDERQQTPLLHKANGFAYLPIAATPLGQISRSTFAAVACPRRCLAAVLITIPELTYVPFRRRLRRPRMDHRNGQSGRVGITNFAQQQWVMSYSSSFQTSAAPCRRADRWHDRVGKGGVEL